MQYETFQILLETRRAQLMAEADGERLSAQRPASPPRRLPRIPWRAALAVFLPRRRPAPAHATECC